MAKTSLARRAKSAYSGFSKRRTGVSKAKFMKLEASKKAMGARLRKLKESSTGAVGVGKNTAVITSGGAIAGALEIYAPDVMGVSSGLIGGSLLVAYAAFSGDSKFGGYAAGLGAGMLACAASTFVQETIISTGYAPALSEAQ
mgnify:CR=1 FL=1